MLRTYKHLYEHNLRIKRRKPIVLFQKSCNIWLLMCQFDFNGSELAEALKRTFEHRKTLLPTDRPLFTEEIYDEKSDRQALWKAFLKKGDITHVPEKLSTTAKAIEKFLIKPLDAIRGGQKFNKDWKAPGSWE